MQNYHNAIGDKVRDAFEKAKRDRDALIERAKKASGDAKKKLEKAIEEAKKKVQAEDKRLREMKERGGAFSVFNQITQKFNPASAIPRGAGLALVRLNWMGIARKLYPALLSEQELKAKNYNLANAKILKTLWDGKIRYFWENLGGDMSALRKAIIKGFDKPVFKTKKVKQAKRAEQGLSFDGNDNACQQEINTLSPFNKWANEFDFSEEESKNILPIEKEYYNACEAGCIALLISTGGSIVIAGINAIAKKGGAKDNPFDPSSPNYKEVQNDPAPTFPPLSTMDEEELKRMELLALEDRKLHGLDDNTYEEEYEKIMDKYDTIWGIKKPIFYTGVTLVSLLALWGIYEGIKYLKNKK